MSKAVIFLADGCEEVEALTVIDVLRRGGVEAVGAAIGSSLAVNGSHGIAFKADCLLADVNLSNTDMVVIPGGMVGKNNIAACEKAVEICKDMAQNGKYVCAICAGPTVLGKNDMLNSVKATCYPGLEKELKGAIITDENVVVDKNFITSKGPATAMEFSLYLLEALEGEKVANAVADGLLF